MTHVLLLVQITELFLEVPERFNPKELRQRYCADNKLRPRIAPHGRPQRLLFFKHYDPTTETLQYAGKYDVTHKSAGVCLRFPGVRTLTFAVMDGSMCRRWSATIDRLAWHAAENSDLHASGGS